jgi:hypothetical protein
MPEGYLRTLGPGWAATLATSRGTKTRKPQAALSPSPIMRLRSVSIQALT